MTNGTARIWIGTIPYTREYDIDLLIDKQPKLVYVRGQLECGETTGYYHIQCVAHFKSPVRLSCVKKTFICGHWEPTRSESAESYVWKESTRVGLSQFEWGSKPLKRNCDKDWAAIVDNAKRGRLDDIPPDVLVRCYSNLKRICVDNLQPVGLEREIVVYWGRTGTGKSRRAWDEAGFQAYPKDPRSKFWDGYRGQEHVVIDEFRGGIDISHILRWFDRYPVVVEVKGSSVVLSAKKIWITSNLDPREWYPDLDEETKSALMRRMTVLYFGL